MDSFTKTGWWWIPSREEQKIHGELSFSPQEGLIFTGHGTFGPGSWDQSSVIPVILGRTDDASRISLHLSQITRTVGNQEFTAQPTHAFFGMYLTSLGACHFSTVAVDVSELLEWSGLRGFSTETLREDNCLPRYQVTQEHEQIGPSSTSFGEISITASVNYRVTHREAVFTAKPNVHIRGNEERDFDTWMKLCIRPTNELFDLASNRAVGINSITALMRDSDSDDEEQREIPVDIVFNPMYHDDAIGFPGDFGPGFRAELLLLRWESAGNGRSNREGVVHA